VSSRQAAAQSVGWVAVRKLMRDILAQIMTTKEMAKYLRLHQITICKLSKEGKIPSIRIGRVWRFDKEVIDEWIAASYTEHLGTYGKKSHE
jgi:excisionase family DNA binding protein